MNTGYWFSLSFYICGPFFVIPTPFGCSQGRLRRIVCGVAEGSTRSHLSERCDGSFRCQSKPRSLHWGLSDSSKATFFSRRQDLICFSCSIASRMSASVEVDEAILSGDGGKTWERFVVVLVITPLDVIGDPNVQSPGDAWNMI